MQRFPQPSHLPVILHSAFCILHSPFSVPDKLPQTLMDIAIYQRENAERNNCDEHQHKDVFNMAVPMRSSKEPSQHDVITSRFI